MKIPEITAVVCVCVCVCERETDIMCKICVVADYIKYVDTKIGQKANSCMYMCVCVHA